MKIKELKKIINNLPDNMKAELDSSDDYNGCYLWNLSEYDIKSKKGYKIDSIILEVELKEDEFPF